MDRNRITPAFALAVVALVLAPAAAAQVGPHLPGDMTARLAVAAGSLNTSAQLCGKVTVAEAEAARAEGRARLQESGFDPAAYDEGFAQGERETRARWAGMSSAERATACEELESSSEALKNAISG